MAARDGSVGSKAQLAHIVFHGKRGGLRQRYREGQDMRPKDMAHLSPLGFEHINMLGRYAFILPDGIARGELRPLRDPATASHDEG